MERTSQESFKNHDAAKSTEKKLDYYKKQIEQERKIQDLSLKIDSVSKVLEQMPEKERNNFLNAYRAMGFQQSNINKNHDISFER